MTKKHLYSPILKSLLLGALFSANLLPEASAAPAFLLRWKSRIFGQQVPASKSSFILFAWSVNSPSGTTLSQNDAQKATSGILQVLEKCSASPQMHGTYEISLIGHTDADGKDSANLIMGMKRAEAARKMLTNALIKHGAERAPHKGLTYGNCNIVFRCYSSGSSSLLDPANPGSTRNRRAEIRISKLTETQVADMVTGKPVPAPPENLPPDLPNEPATWRNFPQEVEKPVFDDGINY